MRYTLQLIKTSLIALILLTVLTGLLYPALITLIGETVFKNASNGSITAQGSMLIGQTFSDPKYFWGRPSATSPYPDNGASSSGSNLAPSNPALTQAIAARIKALQAADPTNHALVPIDLVTASGSGLDPDISPAAAYYQAGRVAKLRHLNVTTVKQLIAANTTGRQFGLLGEPRVNVLQLNTQLDALMTGNKVK